MEEITNYQAQPESNELANQGRKVKIYMTQEGKSKTYVTNALTWGELQSEIDGDFRKKDVVLKESRHSLSVDSAELPKTDFTLFVYPKESKSGLDASELDYNKIRFVASYLNKKYNTSIVISGATKQRIQDDVNTAIHGRNLNLDEIIKQMGNKKVTKSKTIASKLTAKPASNKEETVDNFRKQSVNSVGNTTTRMDIHIHLKGIKELADAIKFKAALPFARNRDQLATDTVNQEEKSIETARLQKIREAEDLQKAKVAREIEDRLMFEREAEDKERKELENEANDIGRQLRRR